MTDTKDRAAVSPSEPGKVLCKLCGEEIFEYQFSTGKHWVHKQGRPRHLAEPAAPAVPPEPTPVGARPELLRLVGDYADRAITHHFGWPWHGDAQKLYATVFDAMVEFAADLANAAGSRAPAEALEALKRDKPL